jgi:Ca2+-binding RTX toxin-like protein
MVVWNGKGTQPGQEDAAGGLFFQRFDANGNKLGSETRINTTTEGELANIDIEVLPTGHIVAVWEGKGTQPGHEDDVGLFQQIFDADGNKVGTETRIATSTIGTQKWASIQDLEDGSWIVQWQGNGTQPGQEDPHDAVNDTGGGLFFQRFELTNTLAGTSGKNKLTGGMLADVLYGLKGNDTLDGALGNDVLKGGAGKDVLIGGLGKDTFVFDTKENAKTNLDMIKDYSVADDTIWLDNKVFTKLGKKGTEAAPVALNKKFFAVTSKAAAKDKNDYVFYNKKTGKLYYDKDGSGLKEKAVEIATLSKNLKLTFEDFFVI